MPRPALVMRLAGAIDTRIALLITPPGYGKSSLLREWSEHDVRPFVWLSTSELRPATEIRSWSSSASVPGPDDGGLVLAIDDADLVHPLMLGEIVETVLPQLPAHSTLALACRREPDLPLGRLRAHRDLIELREQDLALTAAEVGLLLRQGGLHLEDLDAADELARRTEGWPVGVYLATVPDPGRSHPHDRWLQFDGTDHLVREYFRDEVLSAVSPAVLSFMVRSSVLEELSGPACDAALDREGSAVLLSALARDNLFLRPTDAAHERFRWHRMFRETLQAELRRTQPERVAQIHRRASAWLYDRGDVDGAIDHAVAADDPVRTGDLLLGNVAGYLGRGQVDQVQEWLSAFHSRCIAGSPGLALAAGHSALAVGDTVLAQRWRLAAGAVTPAHDRSTRAGIAIIEAMSPRAGVTTIREASLRAYDLDGEGGQWRPIACLLQGVALYLAGAREAASELLDEGIECSDGVAPGVTSMCLAQRSAMAIEVRDWETAVELTDRAVSELDRYGVVGPPSCALVFAAAAAARAHAGRADEAKRDVRRGIDMLTGLSDFVPWYGAEARILLAHGSLCLADVLRARTLLAEASRLARRCQDAVIFNRWFEDAWEHIDTFAETSLSGPSSLTIAELRILRFLPSHRSFKEIATQLGVSANTVKTQAHAVYRKLGAASRSEAVTRASETGLLGQ